MKNGEVHSEEWMTDAREFWWNNDYINLLISRYNLKDITSIADIGCGKGYMTYKFLPYLNKTWKYPFLNRRNMLPCRDFRKQEPNILQAVP